MKKLRTQRSFALELEGDVENKKHKSQTVPDETMTIREILTKFTRGQRVDAEMRREGKFEENSNFDSEDLEAAGRLDLTDRDEVVDRIREKNEATVSSLNRKKQEALAAKQLAIKKAQEEKQKQTPPQKDGGKPPGASELANE